jgi:hypothetical protein
MGTGYQADNFNPPQVLVPKGQGADADIAGTRVILAFTNSAVIQHATDWLHRYVTFDAEGANVRVVFAATDTALVAVAGTAGGGSLLYANTPQSWRLSRRSRYMAVLCPSGTTNVAMYISSPE